MGIGSISPTALESMRQQGRNFTLLDVRTPAEFQEIHAAGAVLMPLDVLDPAKVIAERENASEPLYIICRSGGRSYRACEMFVAAGEINVVNVEGGTLEWEAAGLPVVRGAAAS